MYDLQRVRFVTGQFYYLQGLRIVPIGLYLVLLATGWLGRQGDCTLQLPALLLALALYFVAGRYYERRFGRVQRQSQRAAEALLVLVALIVFLAANAIDAVGQLPVSLTGLGMASFLFAVYAVHGSRYRQHYAILGVGMLVLSLLPLAWKQTGLSLDRVLLGAFGLAYVVGGVLDHLLLTRTLKPLPDEQTHDQAA
ncbi:MAG: hypothetical protein IT318_10795 [Anaerolineales bacterium]|nr:hypothetical protein [Anaerolineales bacterium]